MPMWRRFWWVIVCLLMGCGPDTIFLRPTLDTPAQHLANGNALLTQEKWRDAAREFDRARELDPFFTEAYVGLAISLGSEGDFEAAVRIMDQARQTAMNAKQHQAVADGEARLHQMIIDQGFIK